MKQLLCIFFLMMTVMANAQQNDAATSFIRWFFQDKQNVIYTDEVPFVLSRFTDPVRSDTIIGGAAGKELLVLSAQEKLGLESALLEMTAETWTPGLLPGAKMVGHEQIYAALKDSSKGWAYFKSTFGAGYYSFSKPYFVKNGSYCIFYSDYSCGVLCGQGEFAVFKKVNGAWQKWKVLGTWQN